MATLRHIGHSDLIERELFALALFDFEELPAEIAFATTHFACFVACDATGVDASALKKFADSLLDAGCVYFGVWGPDCERVHDVFDGACDQDAPVIMTTWHDDESLDDALWFFVVNTVADEHYDSTCGSGLGISIGNPAWTRHIEARLADLEKLRRIVLDEG